MTRPDDIPEDAWDVANAVMQLYFHGTHARNQDQWDAYVLIAASAILADRAHRSALAQPSAPEGWVMVPVEPDRATLERLASMWGYTLEETADSYGAFLEATAARPAEPPPAGFDAVDLDMIKSGDRLGPALGQRVFDALSRATRAEERIAEMDAALEPFAMEGWADENGWTERGCPNDRICDWFGPSDFRRARAIRTRGE